MLSLSSPISTFSEKLNFVQMLKLEHNELLENAKECKKCLETDFLQLRTALTITGACFLINHFFFVFFHLACCMLHFCNRGMSQALILELRLSEWKLPLTKLD